MDRARLYTSLNSMSSKARCVFEARFTMRTGMSLPPQRFLERDFRCDILQPGR